MNIKVQQHQKQLAVGVPDASSGWWSQICFEDEDPGRLQCHAVVFRSIH